ncbi:hypothetical protein QU38_01550, partial [Staphylococcus aureus]
VPGGGGIGKIGLHRRIETQLAALLEQQDRSGGELLGDRTEAEFGLAVVRDLPFEIGRAIALVEQDPAGLRNEHGAHEGTAIGLGGRDLVHSRHVLGKGRRGADEREAEDEMAHEGPSQSVLVN